MQVNHAMKLRWRDDRHRLDQLLKPMQDAGFETEILDDLTLHPRDTSVIFSAQDEWHPNHVANVHAALEQAGLADRFEEWTLGRTIEASANLVATGVMSASATVIGQDHAPHAESIPEGLGVLSFVGAGIVGGYDVGQSVGGPFPGGIAGAVVGGVGACTMVRWDRGREQAFRFVRWLEKRGEAEED